MPAVVPVLSDGSVSFDGDETFNARIVQQLAPALNYSRVMYEAAVGAGANSAGGSDAQSLRLVISGGQWTNGPPAEVNYYDSVFGLGWNLSSSLAQQDPTKPASAYKIETKFSQVGSPFAAEFHTALTSIQGTEHRLFSAFAPHNDSDATQSSISMQGNVIALFDYSINLKIKFDFNGGLIQIYSSLSFLYMTNNAINSRQVNTAGNSTIALPYIDNRDTLVLASPLTSAAGAGGTSSGLVVSSGGISTDALRARAPQAGSATFSLEAGTDQSASAAIAVACTGTTTQAAAAGAVNAVDIGRAVTGANVPANTTITGVTGATSFTTSNALPTGATSIVLASRKRATATMSVDITGSLVLRPDFLLLNPVFFDFHGANGIAMRDMGNGYATIYSFTASKLVSLAPIVTAGYTVATLPAATAALKGARAHVTDALAPAWMGALAGGGAVACPAFCNGAAWVAA